MKRKFLLSTCVLASVSAPVATVVSCGNNSTSKTVSFYDPEVRAKPNQEADVVSFDITDLKDTDLFVDVLLQLLNVKMPRPSYTIAPKDQDSFDFVKSYLKNIHSAQPKIQLINGPQEYYLDFSEMIKCVDELRDFTNKPNSFDLFKANEQYGASVGLGAQNVQGISYSKVIISMQDNMNMTGFLQMFSADNIKMVEKPTFEGFPEYGTTKSIDMQDLIQKHPYLNMLRSYHKVFYDFVNSSFYKKWVAGKTFNVVKNEGVLEPMTSTYNQRGVQVPTIPGQMYDQPNSLILDNTPGKEVYEKETSNLEFVFFYHLMHLNS